MKMDPYRPTEKTIPSLDSLVTALLESTEQQRLTRELLQHQILDQEKLIKATIRFLGQVYDTGASPDEGCQIDLTFADKNVTSRQAQDFGTFIGHGEYAEGGTHVTEVDKIVDVDQHDVDVMVVHTGETSFEDDGTSDNKLFQDEEFDYITFNRKEEESHEDRQREARESDEIIPSSEELKGHSATAQKPSSKVDNDFGCFFQDGKENENVVISLNAAKFKAASTNSSRPQKTSGGRPFKCKYCEKTFRRKVNIAKHVLVCAADSTCKICKKVFPSKPLLEEHLREHSGLFQCPSCPAYYSWSFCLRRHIRDKHTVGITFKCRMCEKVFATEGKKVYHQKYKCQKRLTKKISK